MKFLKAFSIAAMVVAMTAPVHSAAAQDSAIGMWHGVLVTPGAQLTLLFNVREGTAGSLTGDMESIDQGPGKAPLDRIVASANRLAFAIPAAGATFEGVWIDGSQSWNGTFRQGAEFPLVL